MKLNKKAIFNFAGLENIHLPPDQVDNVATRQHFSSNIFSEGFNFIPNLDFEIQGYTHTLQVALSGKLD